MSDTEKNHTNSQQIKSFLDFLKNVELEHNIALSIEEDMNNATQDILHRIELSEDKHHELAYLGESLRITRKQRRQAKDTSIKNKPIVDWIKENNKTIKSLEKLLGEVRKAEKSTENRFYIDKTDVVSKALSPRPKRIRKKKIEEKFEYVDIKKMAISEEGDK